MDDFEIIFEKEVVSHISDFIEEKMYKLKEVKDFSEKSQKLAINIEELDEKIPVELREKFDEMIRLNYQVEEYYFTLAYLLGAKYGKQLENL